MVTGKKQVTCNKSGASNWVTVKPGVVKSKSPEIIEATLAWLKKSHQLVTLIHKEYNSSKTILLDYNDKELSIDKPVGWRKSFGEVRILFKDAGQLWNQLAAKVLSAEGNVLQTKFPFELLRLQRRANYRVDVPRSSKATFMHKGKKYKDFYVQDISAEGVMVYANSGTALSEGDMVADISLLFPAADSISGASIHIRQGRIMRIFSNDRGENCYGMQFHLSHNEEEVLLQYVRQRERELLRKGINI